MKAHWRSSQAGEFGICSHVSTIDSVNEQTHVVSRVHRLVAAQRKTDNDPTITPLGNTKEGKLSVSTFKAIS